jgi:acyl-coenzyme A synthetase/AMP-(fatty) acid ligase
MQPEDQGPERFNIAAWLIDRIATAEPCRMAIFHDREPVAYKELQQLVNRAGHLLLELNCAAGDRVLICLSNSLEWVAAFLAVVKIGAIAVPMSTAETAEQYSCVLAETDSRIAIVHASAMRHFMSTNAALAFIVVGNTSGPWRSWEDILSGPDVSLEPFPTRADDLAFILYTSGSTGRRKAVAHAHRSMLAASVNVAQGIFEMQPDDRVLSISKLCFAHGLGGGFYFPFSVGASTILTDEQPQLDKIADLIVRFRPTVLCAVPSFYAAVIRATQNWLTLDLSCVRLATSGGEPLPANLFRDFKAYCGVEIIEGIGSTETLARFISNRPNRVREGACGIAAPNCEVRLIGDDGQPVADGEVGVLWVKCDSLFSQYWNNDGLTTRFKKDGWLVTEDRLYRDPDGYYYYIERNDGLLKIAGVWLRPGEIESILRESPHVERAVVTGVEDQFGRLRLVAYVKGRPDVRITKSELLKYLTNRVSIEMLPTELIWMSEFPQTPTGKVNRLALPAPTWARRPLGVT